MGVTSNKPTACYWPSLAPGTIVILHDGISNPTRTIQALPQILAAAHRKGLRVVSIGTLKASAPKASPAPSKPKATK
jgi:hypothetical protein